jgi:hypothetical protein
MSWELTSLSGIVNKLDPVSVRKTQELAAQIQAKYDITSAQIMAQREISNSQIQAQWDIANEKNRTQRDISDAQLQTQRDIADQNSQDKRYQIDEGNRTTIEAERIRAKSAFELQERAESLKRLADGHRSTLDTLQKGAEGIFDNYKQRRTAILNSVEENRKLTNGATLSVINAFIQDKLAGRTVVREDYMAERNMTRQMELKELEHKIRMAEMEMEHNARFILKAYELEGVHGAKVEIDRLINEWSK